MNVAEGRGQWQQDRARFEQLGVSFADGLDPPKAYTPPEFKHNYNLALDAMPTLTTGINSAVPFFLTTLIDPDIYKVLFAPNKAAEIFGEVRKGTWLDQTAMFPIVEHVGEVSTYGDYSENGHAGANTNWPQRQSYLFQTTKEYGDLELERAGLARINWVSELDQAAALVMNKFTNLTYFYGLSGLQNFGFINDPSLPAPISPATKAGGGQLWFTAGGAPNATANEVYSDVLALFTALVRQTAGLVDRETKLCLALDPATAVALGFVNTYGLIARKMLEDEFANLRIVTAVQYAVVSASNPQGHTGGNFMQLIAENVEGQATGYCAFNEKFRSHPIVRATSSFKQKVTGGTFGAVVRMPVAIASMLGI
jgi:hypothetical protein